MVAWAHPVYEWGVKLSFGRRVAAVSALALATLFYQGCRSGPVPVGPRYALNHAAIEANDDLAVDTGGLHALEQALLTTFGSPDAPRYRVLPSWREEGFDPNEWSDESSRSLSGSAALFRARCARCHGATGGGDGRMAARFLTRPRDYRLGVFKKTPLGDRARPRHEDLVHILEEGIEGTAMPAWGPFLTEGEIAGLADYVRLLAIRGETERLAVFDYDADDGFDAEHFGESYELAVDRWRRGRESLILPSADAPDPTPERVARGRDLFHGERGVSCARCHGAAGHGDGPSAEIVDAATGERGPFLDDWGDPIRPRDLVCAPLRFGDTPVDIYRRIHAGINGTPMPSHASLLNEDDIWDLVLYVNSLREGIQTEPSPTRQPPARSRERRRLGAG
jgi:mono/diheme cytochrome c family protein